MGFRVLILVTVLLLAACAKKENGCKSPATQASLAEFVNSNVRESLRVDGYDPIKSGLLKVSRIDAFEAIRLDEERDRQSCRAVVRFEVEGAAMPTPVEYDLLPSSGDDSDGPYDTVVRVELPLGAVYSRLKNGVLAELTEKEKEIASLEGLIERIRMVVNAGANYTPDTSDDPSHIAYRRDLAEQGKADLAAREAELEQAKKEVARIEDSLHAGKGGR